MKKKKIYRVLGIDLSIGKVKLCLLTLEKGTKDLGGGWTSLPVKFEKLSEKNFDFSKGLAIAIEAFLDHHQTKADEIQQIVFCTGGGFYMFHSFAEGLRHAGGTLKMLFPQQKIYFIRCDTELIEINDVFELDDSEASAFGCTNFLGTSLMASKIFKNGLALDMGTISTSIIPIINGEIDPIAKYNPRGYMLHRYNTGKHIWYGAIHTPLIYITTKAKSKIRDFKLILRSCSTSTLCTILKILPKEIANIHVDKVNHLPDEKIAYLNMAETIGIDINSISKEELYEIACDIYFQCLKNLIDSTKDVLKNMNYHDLKDLKVLTAGLGKEAFLVPVVKSCGFSEEQIIKISENDNSNIWTASSVYGITLNLLEKITGENFDIDYSY